MISIEGLTARQKSMMDLLWTCSTLEDVQALVKALPTKRDRCDALSLIEIATVESIEQEAGFTQEVQDAAAAAIARASC